MKIIFALGNPGDKYAATRHNVAWRCIDAFADRRNASFTLKPKFLAAVAETSISQEKTLLVKPTTFYNEVGRSLRTIIDFYKVPTENILVLHDDLALPLGTLRIRHAGSSAGNNGIKSTTAHIGDTYARLRIGIANDLHLQMTDADFVLAKFSQAEATYVQSSIAPHVDELVEQFASSGLEDITVRL